MNKIYLIFFTLITSTTLYSQTPDTSLTKKNVKELFKTDFNYVCCGETDPVWSVCFNNDGNYVTLDTIQLYSDKYHYLKGNCCNIVNWTFTNKSTITISKTKVCQEPPIGSVSYDDQDLKIKIKKEDNNLLIHIYKDRKLKDKFVVHSIDSDLMHSGKSGYRITMIRQKITINTK